MKDDWAFQSFNITKSSRGGQHLKKMSKSEGEGCTAFTDDIGGGSTLPTARTTAGR